MTKVLITGGAGFIGSNLAAALLERGDSVTVFDDFSSGRRENLAGLEGDLAIVEGDIRDQAAIAAAIEGHDYVLHQAAVPSVPRSMDDPITSHDVNSRGTLNVLLGARDGGVKRVVFAASSSAYGDSETLPKIETMPHQPKSPYAADKVHGEHLCRVFHTGYGLETVALRYFNIFGPRQSPESDYAAAIPRFVTALLDGRKPTVYGDGEQSRDFTFVANAIEANLRAMTAEKAPGQVFNVGIGERITVNALIATIAKVLGRDHAIDYLPERRGDVKHSLASIDKARELLGYVPVVNLEEGLRRTIDWYRKTWSSSERVGS
jgi:UDP-N-acetylglucosamine/UDP-N-acetyl-alpha-D-glucosaminouronate 4-epimerase